jgi:hypothetical protein
VEAGRREGGKRYEDIEIDSNLNRSGWKSGNKDELFGFNVVKE